MITLSPSTSVNVSDAGAMRDSSSSMLIVRFGIRAKTHWIREHSCVPSAMPIVATAEGQTLTVPPFFPHEAPMFAGLDEINWSALTHAYGSAEDVPGLLRQRASSNPEEASEAGSEFFGNI